MPSTGINTMGGPAASLDSQSPDHVARQRLILPREKKPLDLPELLGQSQQADYANQEHPQEYQQSPFFARSPKDIPKYPKAVEDSAHKAGFRNSTVQSPRPFNESRQPDAAEQESARDRGTSQSLPQELDSPPLHVLTEKYQKSGLALGVLPTNPPVVRDNHDRTPPNKPKHNRVDNLPSHIQRVGHIRHQNSPGSSCGDLEGPSHQPSRRVRRSPHMNFPAGSCHVARSPASKDRSRRSQSRTSNISKKRSRVHKSHAREESGRKQKVLMEQVAQHWNECLQLAEEERELAVQEIGRLQGDMAAKGKELDEARSLLFQRQEKLNEVENRCKTTEEQQKNMLQQNEELTGKVQSLHEDLSKSKQRATQADEKYKAYKVKINEAIEEQQDLYKRSKAYYHHLLQELEQEKGAQNAKAEEVSRYLNLSRQKRAEMQQLFHEFQEQAQVEAAKKDEIIISLEERIQKQSDDLLGEKEAATQWKDELQKGQSETLQALQDLATKVSSLHERCEKNDVATMKTSETIATLSEKFESIAGNVLAISERTVGQCTTAPRLEDFEENIISRLMPTLSTVLTQQDRFADIVSKVGESFGSELSEIKNAMNWYIQNRSENNMYEEMSRQLVASLEEIREISLGTQMSCDSIGSYLESWLCNIGDIKASQDSQMAILYQQQQSMTDLESQVQILGDTYAAHVEKMQNQLLTLEKTDQKAHQDLSQCMDSLHSTLHETKDDSAQRAATVDTAILTLQNQIHECKDIMMEAMDSMSSVEVEQLRSNLQEERSTVARLTEELRKSTHEALESDKLRERWTRDIDIVNSLRSKLSAAHQRLPRVESIAAKLQGIGRLNEFIHSTARYLANGQEWAQRKLRAELQSNSGNTETSEQNMQSGLKIHQQHVPETKQERPDHPTGLDHLALPEGQFVPRKVTVRSPALDFRSPSPPPSIEQEQLRRREGVKPRSILRMTITPEDETEGLEPESLHQPISQSQYNRPVMAHELIVASGTSDKASIVDQIRSGLVPTTKKEQSWVFPTVAEFEESSQSTANSAPVAGEKHPHTVAMGDIHRIAKRFKPGIKEEPLGGLRGSTKSVAKPSGNKNETTRSRQVMQTYSRKSDAQQDDSKI